MSLVPCFVGAPHIYPMKPFINVRKLCLAKPRDKRMKRQGTWSFISNVRPVHVLCVYEMSSVEQARITHNEFEFDTQYVSCVKACGCLA